MILLDAEGPAFCAGYGLDWSTAAQASDDARPERAWDSAADQHVIGAFAETWAKLHDSSKPTIAAVSGWCIAGGTNIVFNAHLIVAGESARFGYPPSRVWGVPEAPWTWVARMGMQHARRYMLTGDEFTARRGAGHGRRARGRRRRRAGRARSMALAQRIAMVPANQLEMITWTLNAVADHQFDPAASRRLGTLFDGVARHSQEGLDFVARSQDVGFREAVRERDRPFGDYGERRSCARQSVVAVFLGDAEADRRGRLEVDLDEHRRVVADHPGVMARGDIDHGRGGEVDGAPVGVLEVHAAVDEEAGVGVHAQVGADERAEVGGPAHPRRVDRPLDAGVADLGDVDLDRSERLVDRARHRREEPHRSTGLAAR